MKLRIRTNRLLLASLVSLGIHGLFLFWIESQQLEPKTIPVTFLTLNDAPTFEASKVAKPSHLKATPPPANSKLSKAPALDRATQHLFVDHHRDLILNPNSDTAIENSSKSETTASILASIGENHGWSPAVRYGNAMGLEETTTSLPYFLALHQKVDSALVYPEDFARQRITGKVRIEAELDGKGQLVRFLSFQGESDVLQTFCFAYLTQILSQPLHSRSWMEKSTIVAFDFDFRTRITGEPKPEIASFTHKNLLSFGRVAEVDPWLNEKINEIFTHYIPPIVPIPGGFYIQFDLAYLYIKNLIENAPTESQARAARIEKLHDRMKQMIQNREMQRAPEPTPTPSES